MEVIIKISKFPENVKIVADYWKEIVVEADGKQTTVTARPKMPTEIENKLDDNFPNGLLLLTEKSGV